MAECFRDKWRRAWIQDGPDDPVLREFLHVLHFHMNHQGECWVSKATIAREMGGRDRSTVVRKDILARELGLIEEPADLKTVAGKSVRIYRATQCTPALPSDVENTQCTPALPSAEKGLGSAPVHSLVVHPRTTNQLGNNKETEQHPRCGCGKLRKNSAGDLCAECMSLRFQKRPYGEQLVS